MSLAVILMVRKIDTLDIGGDLYEITTMPGAAIAVTHGRRYYFFDDRLFDRVSDFVVAWNAAQRLEITA